MRVAFFLLLATGTVACSKPPSEPAFVEVDGERVPAAVLRRGEFVYTRWCRQCHGLRGDGIGTRGWTAEKRPRDLRTGEYRYAGVLPGQRPPDAFFAKIIHEGIPNSLMKPMPVPDEDIAPLVTYIRSLVQR